jgi:hypothetical protein
MESLRGLTRRSKQLLQVLNHLTWWQPWLLILLLRNTGQKQLLIGWESKGLCALYEMICQTNVSLSYSVEMTNSLAARNSWTHYTAFSANHTDSAHAPFMERVAWGRLNWPLNTLIVISIRMGNSSLADAYFGYVQRTIPFLPILLVVWHAS